MMGVCCVNMVSLCSGVGCIDLAASWYGIQTVLFCEIDPYCQQVLAKRFSGIPLIPDIRDVTAERVREVTGLERIDIVCGGWPCQPHSVAGKRLGAQDERDLWPEFRRVLRDLKPRWFVGENVPGILSTDAGRFFGTVLQNLAEMGFDVRWGVHGACDVGAPHRRDRVFLLAHATGA
ncbi:DNA cytosine methyltransferase [Alicyclobacillus sendaiensis]|uniref:DNA cytosine methyltransferase n=1 Tax=Alicyclobacillus sendaiensis TaxID=192387 RepID=UPI00350E4DC2